MSSELEDKAAAKDNQELGWCPCGEELDYECECFGLNRLTYAQGKVEPRVKRTVDAFTGVSNAT